MASPSGVPTASTCSTAGWRRAAGKHRPDKKRKSKEPHRARTDRLLLGFHLALRLYRRQRHLGRRAETRPQRRLAGAVAWSLVACDAGPRAAPQLQEGVYGTLL